MTDELLTALREARCQLPRGGRPPAGVSASMVNQALKSAYGDVERLQALGRGLADEPNRGLSRHGDMPKHKCLNTKAARAAWPSSTQYFSSCAIGPFRPPAPKFAEGILKSKSAITPSLDADSTVSTPAEVS